MAYTSVFPNEVSIYVAPAGTNGSALTAAQLIVGEITNWKVSGGMIAKDLVNVFGGQLDIRKPREQVEISFDIYVNNTFASSLDRWHSEIGMTDGTADSQPVQKAIFIAQLSNSKWNTLAVNYADLTTCDTEMASDDALKCSVSFKANPLSTLGVSNLNSSSLAPSVAFFTW